MPGGVPVAALAIGKAGATNAGLLAVAILSSSRPDLRARLRAFARSRPAKVRGEVLPASDAAGVDHQSGLRARRARERPAGPHVHDLPRGGSATVCTRSRRTRHATGQVADVEVTASYEDLDALRAFASNVSVVTFEFENVPMTAVEAIEDLAPIRPSGRALYTAQQRAREKAFLAAHGLPVVPFATATTLDELTGALAQVGGRRW
jgi:hypothetical protein